LVKDLVVGDTIYNTSLVLDSVNDETTYYYYFAGRRIAVRSSAGLSYLYNDNPLLYLAIR
jgi:hypothetical protein